MCMYVGTSKCTMWKAVIYFQPKKCSMTLFSYFTITFKKVKYVLELSEQGQDPRDRQSFPIRSQSWSILDHIFVILEIMIVSDRRSYFW